MSTEQPIPDKTIGIMVHIGTLIGAIIPFGNVLLPLMIYLIKKDSDEFSTENAKRSFNFQLSWSIYLFVLIITFIMILFYDTSFSGINSTVDIIGVLVIMGVMLFSNLLLILVASFRASDGKYFDYPLTIPFIAVK